MPGFKLYEVSGYPEPLRLSPEHAEALGGTEVTETAPGAPSPDARKADWVEFAVSQGASEETAQSQTRAQLIEQYGTQG